MVDQYTRELAVDQPEPSQLLLQVNGQGGTGKTEAILTTYARLQELAATNGKQNPVFRSAPTGVAAYAITGKTPYSLLYLLVRGKMSDLSTATLQSLQAMFQECRFLMIDEKLMIDLKMLSLIDDRLRVIFPATSHLPFGGMNVLISGDFYQLPPVKEKPFYSLRASHVDEIKGQQLYRAFNKTIWLTQVMRQLGDNPLSVWFRQTLGELREGKLTQEGWDFLYTHVTNQLSSVELSFMDGTLRLYFTRAEVHQTNMANLAAMNKPVKKISAQHTGQKATKASEEEADNLSAKIYMYISVTRASVGEWGLSRTKVCSGAVGVLRVAIRLTGPDRETGTGPNRTDL